MKVWFDHQIFSIQRYGGVSRYFAELLQALRKLEGIEAEAIAPAHVNAYLKAIADPGMLTFEMLHPRKGLRYRPKYTAPLFALAQWVGSPDVIHETHYVLGSQHLSRKAKVVSTCHDLVFEKYPQWVPGSKDRVRLKKQTFDRADAIICISHNTRKDLLDLYPQFESKAFTVHHGVDHTPAPTSHAVQLPGPYLLYVGVRQGYKNFDKLLSAIGRSRLLSEEFHLVCFGGGPLSSQEKLFAESAGMKPDRLHHLAGDDQLLAYAYRNASAFVFPSLYEGFGMPLTEAMVHGCPVACSNASCFPEICGDAAKYFDCQDPDDISRVLEEVVSGTDAQKEKRRLRSLEFTWQRCASETASVYRRLV